MACTCSLRAAVADHRLLHLQRGVLGHREVGADQPASAAPRAPPSSSVDCGLTLTKTISIEAQSGGSAVTSRTPSKMIFSRPGRSPVPLRRS